MTATNIFLYMLVLGAYAPGLLALSLYRRVWHYPILCFAFIGMFVFNAMGSIAVFSEVKLYWLNFNTGDVSTELALMLATQAFLFYVVCGPYILLKPATMSEFSPALGDRVFVLLAAGAIILISTVYYRQTGGFLVQFSLDGSMHTENAFAYRQKFVYGIPNWPIYSLAFVFIPILLSNHGLLLFLGSGRKTFFLSIWCFAISFVASLSLGSKGGLLGFLLSLSVAYISFLGMAGVSPYAIFRSRKFQAFSAFALATLIFGYSMAAPETLSAAALAQRILYRTFVAYPETLAATISFFHAEGPLGISVFPTMRGLLSHEQVILSSVIHQYQANTVGGVSVPFAGEAFLVAGWTSFLLLLPIVFATLIFLQEISNRLKIGMFGVAFASIYGYLAIQLSLNGMFGSLYNFMFPGTVITLGVAAIIVAGGCSRLKRIGQ